MPKSLDDVLNLPPIKWRIDRLLPEDGLMVIGGAPGRGKSRLSLDIARRLIQGRPLFGFLGCVPAKHVLVHNVEGGYEGVRARATMFDSMTPDQKACLFVEPRPIVFTLANGQPRPAAIEEAKKAWAGFDVVVLDPLVHFRSCDENNNQHSAALMNSIREAAQQAGCAVIVVHHARKSRRDEEPSGEQLRGATAILAAADSTIILRKADDASVEITFDKLRYAALDDNMTGLVLTSDRVSGCFYRRVVEGKSTMPDVDDWKEDWGSDPQRYALAFAVTPEIARRVLS